MFKNQFEISKSVKAILFDFDGVLVDSVDVKTAAFAEIFKDFPTEAKKQALDYHLRHGGISRYEKIRYAWETVLGKKISDAEVNALARKFGELSDAKVVEAPAVPGSLEFLEKNFGRYKFFVVSGTPETELRRIVAQRGMTRFFFEVHGSPAKKVDLINQILGRHGYKRDEVVFVGDSITDYDAATQAGVTFVSVVG